MGKPKIHSSISEFTEFWRFYRHYPHCCTVPHLTSVKSRTGPWTLDWTLDWTLSNAATFGGKAPREAIINYFMTLVRDAKRLPGRATHSLSLDRPRLSSIPHGKYSIPPGTRFLHQMAPPFWISCTKSSQLCRAIYHIKLETSKICSCDLRWRWHIILQDFSKLLQH